MKKLLWIILQLDVYKFSLKNWFKDKLFYIFLFLTKSFHSSKINLKRRLSKAERSSFTLDDLLKQVLLGNLLGYVYMRRFSEKDNARTIFIKRYKNAEYLLHLYGLFQHFFINSSFSNNNHR